jgi:hypothetical protein
MQHEWGEGRHIQGKPDGKITLGDPGVDGRIICRWIFRKWDVGMWTGSILSRDRGRWWALLNAVMNLQIALNCGEFLD